MKRKEKGSPSPEEYIRLLILLRALSSVLDKFLHPVFRSHLDDSPSRFYSWRCIWNSKFTSYLMDMLMEYADLILYTVPGFILPMPLNEDYKRLFSLSLRVHPPNINLNLSHLLQLQISLSTVTHHRDRPAQRKRVIHARILYAASPTSRLLGLRSTYGLVCYVAFIVC
jgi:hypothetical protein